MAEKRSLNENWKFVKDSAEYPSGAEAVTVSLPHTWNAEDGQDGGNDYFRGTCWYIRALEKPEIPEGGQAWLEFEGAAMTAGVYLNGIKLAEHAGGYSTFRVNITKAVREAEGRTLELAVSVNNGGNGSVYPQSADFTFYGGLYRGVSLILVPQAHFELGYCGGSGLKVTPVVKDLNTGKTEVTVETWVSGGAEQVRFAVGEAGSAGKRQAEAREVDAGKRQDWAADEAETLTVCAPVKEGYVRAVFTMEHARLWDGLEDPFLYAVTASLENGEQVSARFGCRQFAMDPRKGFLLNGRSYPLRGVSRHQDRRGVGNALTLKMHREDLELILEMGANTVRLAHYQHAQEFYDLCDERGLVLWAEIPYITMHMPGGCANTLSQMEELVVQNYNHPSIVCWGLSNEITAASAVDEDLLENHRLLNELCHRLDATRPTTMANVFMLETDSPLLEIPDINSYNLYFGWYLGELEQNDEFFDEYHQKFPDRCIGLSEYGADANIRFHSACPERGDYTESYQCVYHEHMLKMIEERPWLWATHVWNMFDFAADGRDEGGEHGLNQKGLVTIDRKQRKDAFYLYKAYWSRTPFVHLCGSRYTDRAEEVTEVKVYSNLPKVSLYVDGSLFEEQEGSRVFVFRVPITGEHSIECRGEGCSNVMLIRRVAEPNPEYCFNKKQEIVNWFDREDYHPDCYSVMDTLGELAQNPEANAIVEAMMAKASASRGDVAESVKDNPALKRMMARMTVQSLLKQAGDAVPEAAVRQLNAALQRIRKNV